LDKDNANECGEQSSGYPAIHKASWFRKDG
jgi:hypothetical protein